MHSRKDQALIGLSDTIRHDIDVYGAICESLLLVLRSLKHHVTTTCSQGGHPNKKETPDDPERRATMDYIIEIAKDSIGLMSTGVRGRDGELHVPSADLLTQGSFEITQRRMILTWVVICLSVLLDIREELRDLLCDPFIECKVGALRVLRSSNEHLHAVPREYGNSECQCEHCVNDRLVMGKVGFAAYKIMLQGNDDIKKARKLVFREDLHNPLQVPTAFWLYCNQPILSAMTHSGTNAYLSLLSTGVR